MTETLSLARAVKARRARHACGLPTLWLFTDQARLPDPLAAARACARIGGVVLRDDSLPERRALDWHEKTMPGAAADAGGGGDWRLAAALAAGRICAPAAARRMPRWLPC